MKREISLLSVDADRERASVALASVAPNLQSGYYRLQARGLKSRAILGISGEFYVAGFETFLLSPVLADIQEPTGALEALPTYSDVLPIRWHFNNPGKRVGSVDVVLRAVQNPSLVFPIAHDLSLSRRRHQMVSLDWTLPVADLRKARLLETAVRLDVFPHVPVTSNAGGGFAVSGALTASRAVSGPFVLADASDNTSPFAERAREFRHDALLFSSHEGVGQHWTLGTTTKVPQAVRMDPRTRGAARELRLVVPNAEHIVKATRSLDAGIGEVFLVPPDLASGTMVFIKAVDAQRPDRVLGATGPFWLDGLYAQIFMPGSGDLGVRPGEKIFFAWRLPSSERANAEVALWVRGNEQRMNAKIPRAQRNGDTWRSTWTVPCQMPRGKYTVVQRLSSATTNSPKAAGRDAYSPPLLHFNVVSLEAGVTAPLHRDTWRPGMRARIAWVVDINENACLWPAAKPVDIVVQLLAGGQEMVLAQEVPNSGEIFVNLPRDLAEDHAAHVLIKPHDTSAAGYMTLKSEPFRIARVPLGTYLPLDELGGQAGAERSPHVISGASHSHSLGGAGIHEMMMCVPLKIGTPRSESGSMSPGLSTSGAPVPFEVRVSEEAIEDLRLRLARRKKPAASIESPGTWTDGTDAGTLDDLMAYWASDFDWRAHETQLNSFDHFMLDGMHFIHQRSACKDAIPLLLVHGWPGSVVEFLDMIPLLTKGDGKGRAFHVVAPSLPGFAWSRDLARHGGQWGARSTAALFKDLMAHLGYPQFVAQAGDWGAVVVHWLAADHPQACVAVHQNMPTVGTRSSRDALTAHGFARTATAAAVNLFPRVFLDKTDQTKIARRKDYLLHGSAYFLMHCTKPHQLGVALQDSPVALASWILEKMHAWTDFAPERGVFDGLSKDQILCNLSVYWFTQSIASSCRFYFETVPVVPGVSQRTAIPWEYCETPLGCSTFPKEVLAETRPVVAMAWNLKQWKTHDFGGHFAAWEAPAVLAQDVREFFHEVLDFETCKREATERRGLTFREPSSSSSSSTFANVVSAGGALAAAAGVGALVASRL
ncbi:Epoxide hydrolase 1 [Hondaea fermentalgiana]|uniref:Epoxide hydrolase 1 n=1 Tax=Hondaea fermentalgiana TaxID=2315210 RepID=A0A2R5GE16_9STRA|nr:Epoxide hydrolase 1 [Hondaea fermentalgiana]|eukprot:GBG29176.1 Epoxide hydrolase 1 [Hondaea fermentalgiana]